MPKITLRPTVLGDLPYVIGESLPFRIKAITAEIDGQVIGIGGLAFPPGEPLIALVQLAPAPASRETAGDTRPLAKKYPVAFHRAGLGAIKMFRDFGAGEVVATADATSDAAARWLKRLGFKPAPSQPIHGKIIFIWKPGD
jgi:hypothetical protein